jgi:hypothetical protein
MGNFDMKSMKYTAASLILTGLLSTAASAAAVNVAFLETASGVTMSGSGAFDTTGLAQSFADFDTSDLIFVSPEFGSFGAGAPAIGTLFSLAPITPRLAPGA